MVNICHIYCMERNDGQCCTDKGVGMGFTTVEVFSNKDFIVNLSSAVL